MQVLAIFLVIFLGVSLLLRVPVAFGIGLGGAAVFTIFGYSMNSFSQTGFYGLDNFSLRYHGVLRYIEEHLQLH